MTPVRTPGCADPFNVALLLIYNVPYLDILLKAKEGAKAEQEGKDEITEIHKPLKSVSV